MNNRRISRLILAADLLWLLVALLLGYLIRYGSDLTTGFSQPMPWGSILLLMVLMAGWLLLFEPMGLDCFRSGWSVPSLASRTSTAVFFQIVIVVTWGYLSRLYYSRLVLMLLGVLFWIGVVSIRVLIYGLLRKLRRHGKMRRIVILGEGHVQRELVSRIEHHPELLYEVVGFLRPFESTESAEEVMPAPQASSLGSPEVVHLLMKLRVQEIFVLLKQPPGLELQNLLAQCRTENIHVNILPQPYELYVSRPVLTEIDGMPFVSLVEHSISPMGAVIKRLTDLVLGAVLFVPGMMIALAGGGVLWFRRRLFLRTETRCGLNGQPFQMYRLAVDTDPTSAQPVDRFLRRYSISELPQLLNVLRGEMSLVGPRPESPGRVKHYSDWQKQRLRFKPGMTGLAQVNGLREEHSSDDKARHDLLYMLHWSPVLDLVLLLQTLWTIAGRFVRNGREKDEFQVEIHRHADEARTKLRESATD